MTSADPVHDLLLLAVVQQEYRASRERWGQARDDRERLIADGREHGMSAAEIAQPLGLTASRVINIMRAAAETPGALTMSEDELREQLEGVAERMAGERALQGILADRRMAIVQDLVDQGVTPKYLASVTDSTVATVRNWIYSK